MDDSDDSHERGETFRVGLLANQNEVIWIFFSDRNEVLVENRSTHVRSELNGCCSTSNRKSKRPGRVHVVTVVLALPLYRLSTAKVPVWPLPVNSPPFPKEEHIHPEYNPQYSSQHRIPGRLACVMHCISIPTIIPCSIHR
jgi:hypothetical protein